MKEPRDGNDLSTAFTELTMSQAEPKGIDPDADHYVVRVTNFPPTELECKCGIRTEGTDCLERMGKHVREGNSGRLTHH